MAYSTSNPPRLRNQDIASEYGKEWTYFTTDAITVVRVAGYITDAGDLGMKVGDLVYTFVVDDVDAPTSLTGASIMPVVSITSGAADLSDGTAISVTDTD